MTQLPPAFVESISRYPQLTILSESLLQQPVTSVRINPLKCKEVPSSLYTLVSGQVPWCNYGHYLRRRPQFTFDPHLHQGVYYVQDASSMAISAILRQITCDTPVTYLDACAAPGGKTTCAVSSLPDGSVVVANEYDNRRASILYENMSKWGGSDIVVSRGDTSKLVRLGEMFDIVAVDAPCSGEGMMRKDSQAIEQWSPHLIDSCVALQRKIIANAMACLKPGGYLIYSTCTFNLKENEENLKWAIDEFGLTPVMIDCLETSEGVVKGIDCDLPCYRFIPGKIEGEGLFISVLKKYGSAGIDLSYKSFKDKFENICCKKTADWVSGETELWTEDNEIWAAHKKNAKLIRYISSHLDTISHGVHVASIKGKDVVPCNELALSEIFNRNAFPNVELTVDQALLYLQRDNIVLPDDTPRGFVLLTYDDRPLGFVKNIGNRSNNLLPKQWRILSRH